MLYLKLLAHAKKKCKYPCVFLSELSSAENARREKLHKIQIRNSAIVDENGTSAVKKMNSYK